MAELDDVSMARAVYDASACRYAEVVGTDVTASLEAPVDRALLAAFVEGAAPQLGPIADLGCGTGRVTALLAGHALDVIGVDLSTAMLAAARTAHPEIPFVQAQLAALPFAEGSLSGAVCWYSTIHTPPARLIGVAEELSRVLADDAHLLIAFQSGRGEGVHRANAYESGLPLTSYRHDADDVAGVLSAAGLPVYSRTVREPQLDHEQTPQAFLLARRTHRPRTLES